MGTVLTSVSEVLSRLLASPWKLYLNVSVDYEAFYSTCFCIIIPKVRNNNLYIKAFQAAYQG